MTKQQQFTRMVLKVGKSFYIHFIKRVRQSVKDGTLNSLFATAGGEWPGNIKTVRFRLSYMARAVRAGYDFTVSPPHRFKNKQTTIKKGTKSPGTPKNYWIEMYWPSIEGRQRCKEYDMWINKRKKATHKNISAGDIVFYYETQWKGKDRSVEGAMRLFAAGVVTDDFSPVTKKYRNVDGKKWSQWRNTKIIAWVPPSKGIPREVFNKAIGKQEGFIMRYAPYKIKTPAGAVKILNMLQRLDTHSIKSFSKFKGSNKDDEREFALSQAAASGNMGTLSPSEREGLRKLRKSWRIERSAKNRRLARIKWGNNCSCVVCRVNFNKKYGQDIARGYIEFHHLRPLSAGAYTPRPEKDLVPVCSNCHSMLHRRRPNPIPILELQERLGQ